MRSPQWMRAGLFKGSAFVIAIILLCGMIAVKPKLINVGYDLNLSAIKAAARIVPAQYGWWGDVFEAGLRFSNAEKIFFFMEVVVLVKLALLALGRSFRRNAKEA